MSSLTSHGIGLVEIITHPPVGNDQFRVVKLYRRGVSAVMEVIMDAATSSIRDSVTAVDDIRNDGEYLDAHSLQSLVMARDGRVTIYRDRVANTLDVVGDTMTVYAFLNPDAEVHWCYNTMVPPYANLE